jgi:predicted dehydrogenase
MDRVQIGVIGLGIMGQQYVKLYGALAGVEVVAVADHNEERLQQVAGQYGVEGRYSDYRRMLDEAPLDAVVVATPDFAHFEPAKAALEAGKHLAIEKPMTTSTAEADELLRLSRSSGRKVQVNYNHRWLGPYHHGKQAILKGDIGTPLAGFARKNDTIFVPTEYISWAARSTPAWFLSAHDVDLLRWYFDAEPIEARAWGRREVLCRRGIETYDLIQAQVKFSSGAIAVFESAWIYPNTFPSIVDSFVEVIGSEGHLHFDRKCESIEISTPRAFSYPKNFLNAEIFGRARGAFPGCVEDFVTAIIEDREPSVTAFDGRQVTATLEAIHRSLESGETVAVPSPPAAT